MSHLPEAAVIAAAQAIFNHCSTATCPPGLKARQWLQGAEEYREIARVALTAALPHLNQNSP